MNECKEIRMSNSETPSDQGDTRMTDAHLDWAKMCARAGEHEAALENLEAALAVLVDH
jgi:hypothetical protein